MSINELRSLIEAAIDWYPTDTPYLFSSVVNGETVYLRFNDFPDEPPCTVIFAKNEIDLEGFPSRWTLPGHRDEVRDAEEEKK